MLSFDQTGLPPELENKLYFILAKLLLERKDNKLDNNGFSEILDKTHCVEYDYKTDILTLHTMKKFKNKIVDVDIKRFKDNYLYERIQGNDCHYQKQLDLSYTWEKKEPKYFIHGHYHKYYPNGILAEETFYNRGMKHGRSREWYEDGARKLLITYVGMDYYGHYIEYNRSGKKIKEGFKYENHDLGEWREYDGHDFPIKDGFIYMDKESGNISEYTVKQAKRNEFSGPWLDHKHNYWRD
jgi:antitoxin component YwqK of YwqJK toxin-antitoxin module